METERTKDRRLLREKRLAYFEKVGLTPKPQPHPPKEARPASGSYGTESKESGRRQTNKKGNSSARKYVNKSNDLSKRKANGHVTPLTVSSSPRRLLGATSGGSITPKKRGQQTLIHENNNNLEPGARPKVRGQQYVNGGSWSNGNHVDNRKRSDVNRNQILRNTFDLNEREVTKGQRSVVEVDEYSNKYESLTWNRLEAARDGKYDALLAPVSVPMVIPAEHGLFKMGTKEQPQEQTREDDLHEVFKLERRYDYPRGRDLGRLSYEDAQKAAIEHNAFGVESMLNEMRQVRRVKSQLHEELKESFETFGSVSEILGKGNAENCEEGSIRAQMLDDSTGQSLYNNLGKNWGETDVEVNTIGPHDGIEINHSRKKRIGHWSLETQENSLENQQQDDEKVIFKTRSIDGYFQKGFGDVDIVQTGDMDVRCGTRIGQNEDHGSESKDKEIDEEAGHGKYGDENTKLGGSHGDNNKLEMQEEDEFNLGALCAAAKQGDDILKDYIKRLTQKILKKDDVADTKEPHMGRSKITEGWETNEQGLDGEAGTSSVKPPEKITNYHHDEGRLFKSSRLVNGYDHLLKNDDTVSKVHTPVYSSDQLNQWGHLNQSIDDTKVEDLISNDSESSGHENHRHGSTPLQSPGVSQLEGELGFETHRPSNRSCSPLKVVRFAGSEEYGDRFTKGEEGKDLYMLNRYREDCNSPPGKKELEDTGDTGKQNREEDRIEMVWNHKEHSLSFQGIADEENKEESLLDEINADAFTNKVKSGDAEASFDFFRDVDPSSSDPLDSLHFHQSMSQSFHIGQIDSYQMDSSRKIQTESNEDAREKARSARRPRTPEEHKRGVERHHKIERQKERLKEVVSEEEEGGDQHENGMQGDDLRLSLGSVNTSTEVDQDTFFTEVPSGNMQSSSNMHSHDLFAYEVNERQQGKSDEDDDESVLMQKISQFHPSVGVAEEGNGSRGSIDIVNGYHGSDNGYHGNENSLASQPELFHRRRDNETFQPQASLPPSDDFTNLSINPSMPNSHDLSLDSREERKGTTDTRKENTGPLKTKSQGVRPKSASQLRRSASSQYKSQWPQSSTLIPCRPKKVNRRFSSPDRKVDKKARPASAKVSVGSLDVGNKGQRARPRSAIQQGVSVEPGAGGDFFNVKSSKMFDGGVTRASLTGPLTLKLIQDSPRERQHHSIWQLLPDEILLRIFSHLKHQDLVSCAQVCQGFYRVAMDDSLWRFVHLEKKHLSDYQLTQIGMKHPTSVVFLQCNGKSVTENGLRNLFRTCVDSLQELNVSGCSGEMFSGDSVLLHASRCYNLSNIDASWCNVTDNGLNAVSGGCNRLSSVCLNGCQSVTDAGLRSLVEKHAPNLIVLEVFGCIDLSPLTLQRIGDICKNLHSLNIGQCYKVTDESVYEVMPKLRTLRHLDVRGCKQIRDDCVRRIARSCKRLETLVLANCNFVSNVSMVEIAATLKHIRSLDVSGCKKITSEGVRSVAMCCTKLTALNLSSTSIDRKSISSLASYCSTSLRELKLNCCKDITEASIIKLLKHCKRMETVHLYGVKGLRNLGLLKLQYPCLMYE